MITDCQSLRGRTLAAQAAVALSTIAMLVAPAYGQPSADLSALGRDLGANTPQVRGNDNLPEEAFVDPVMASTAREQLADDALGSLVTPADDGRITGQVVAPARGQSPPSRRRPGSDPEQRSPEILGPEASDADFSTSYDDFIAQASEVFLPGAVVGPDARENFRLTLTTSVGYDDNVLLSSVNPEGSGTSGLNAAFLYNLGSQRLDIKTGLSAGVTYYDNRSSDNSDLNANYTLDLAYQASRRLTITANLQVLYLSQPDPQLEGGTGRFQGDYYVTDDSISLAFKLTPRWLASLRYQFTGFRYTDPVVNANSGFYQQVIAFTLQRQLNARTSVFVEYRANPVTFYEADVGSNGQILTLGFDHLFAPQARWNFQFGAEQRELTNPGPAGPSGYTGPFLETNFSYQFAPRSSLDTSLRFGTEPSGSSSLAITETLRGTIAVNYAFTGRLSGNLGLSYLNQQFDLPSGVADTEQTVYSLFAGLRYRLNTVFALRANYNFDALETESADTSYTRGLSSLGLEVAF